MLRLYLSQTPHFFQIDCGHTVIIVRWVMDFLTRKFKISYRTRDIITHDLYIFHPIFEVHYFVFQGGFFTQFYPYDCIVSIQERVVIKSEV